jgi:hypothetical protein
MHLLLLHIDEPHDERLPSREVSFVDRAPDCFDPRSEAKPSESECYYQMKESEKFSDYCKRKPLGPQNPTDQSVGYYIEWPTLSNDGAQKTLEL